MSTFTLPDLGEGLQDAEIVTWHVGVGDHVIADQPLLSVETDKAVVEVPAPFSGTITRLVADEGAIVKIGAPLVEIDIGKATDAGAIVGDLAKSPAAPPPKPLRTGTGARATPAVRRLAVDMGVDLASLTGTGPGEAVTSADVEAAATGLTAGQVLSGVRRSMARAMARAHASVVPATVTERSDISGWDSGEDVTTRLIHAIATGCYAEPALNAWFDGQRRQLHDNVDLAIAVDTPEGLFTPVLRDAGHAADLGPAIAALKRSVEDRSIAPDAMKGATFTLSNFGMLGGEFAALVVTPPQVAILGAGRITDTVHADNGQPVVHRTLPLSLTFDHRAATGGEAARFLSAVREDLERPKRDARE